MSCRSARTFGPWLCPDVAASRLFRRAPSRSLFVATTLETNELQHTTFSYKANDTSLVDRQNHQLVHLSFIDVT